MRKYLRAMTLGVNEKGYQRLKCKMQNCGGPSGGLLFVAGLISVFYPLIHQNV